jgi:steroid 5-alpha reductase family enzyme
MSVMLGWYFRTDPMTTALWICAALALWSWTASIATGNYSQVDRLWSLAPPLYVFHFAAHVGFGDARLDLMLALTLAWGARLTYNFARKGGYRRGGEDYRWPELRRRVGPVAFQLLNATFIAPAQNLLLLLLAAPAYAAWLARGASLSALDAVAAAAFTLFWIGEAVADEQQWRFQAAKQARRERGEAVGGEFLSAGLFRYSRHPNFFCEQAMWWSFYLFAVAATGQWLNRWIAGPLFLTLLFQGSTRLTESLTAAKYPTYREYQSRTSRLIPWPRRQRIVPD